MPLLSLRPAGRVPFAVPVAATRGPSVLGGRRLFGFVILRLMLAEHDLAVVVKRQSLQHYIEALAIFVREPNADIEPVYSSRASEEDADQRVVRETWNIHCFLQMLQPD
jgi:hypothetical protein